MNDRERFIATMHYRERDRCPIMDFGFWDETITEWKKQGLPEYLQYREGSLEKNTVNEYFGMDIQWMYAPIYKGLKPNFEYEILEEDAETQIIRQTNGVICQQRKKMDSIPKYLDWPLKDRKSWQEFKKRLLPNTPGRYPDNWKQKVQEYSQRDYPLGIHVGSLYGWIRDWMGVENVSYLLYEDPDLFQEMVEYNTDFFCEIIKPALISPIQFDYAMFWEDMCFRNGPLMSPQMFAKYLVPNYQKITGLLRQHGVDVIMLDCDGCIDLLVPHWLEAGVNCMFPIEIGTWNADPVKFRKQYGKELLMIGGFNKLLLAKNKSAIEKEIYRLLPLVEEGGFIPLPDHRVPPDVPLVNYLFYLETVKKVFGKSTNLKSSGYLE